MACAAIKHCNKLTFLPVPSSSCAEANVNRQLEIAEQIGAICKLKQIQSDQNFWSNNFPFWDSVQHQCPNGLWTSESQITVEHSSAPYTSVSSAAVLFHTLLTPNESYYAKKQEVVYDCVELAS